MISRPQASDDITLASIRTLHPCDITPARTYLIPNPSPNRSKTAGGFFLEFMGTLLLIFVVFNVAGKPLENDIAGSCSLRRVPSSCCSIGLSLCLRHRRLTVSALCLLAILTISGSTISALAPLPIGLAVAVSHLTLGPLTGCGINPARIIGAVVWEGKDWWDGRSGQAFWIYIAGPFAASLVGPLLYAALYGTVSPGSAGKAGKGKLEGTAV